MVWAARQVANNRETVRTTSLGRWPENCRVIVSGRVDAIFTAASPGKMSIVIRPSGVMAALPFDLGKECGG